MNKLIPLIIISLFIAGCCRDVSPTPPISPDTKVVVAIYAPEDVIFVHCLRSDVTELKKGIAFTNIVFWFTGDDKPRTGWQGPYEITVEGNNQETKK